MHRKIYFGNKPLYLTDSITKDIEDFLHRDDAVFIDEFNVHAVGAMIHEMEQEKIHAGVFLHTDLEELLNGFKKKLTPIIACGGLVHTGKQELLLIFRKGKWDLPKGKLDDGESLEECALREVKEETGLEKAALEKPVCITYHTYHQDGKHILKESHWFLMKSPHQKVLTPQTDEDIEQCKWVPAAELSPYLDLTHASVLDVLKEGVKLLTKS
jgi:8-oxo-dGTP pyrophosphatase MutT (NUDIX family)